MSQVLGAWDPPFQHSVPANWLPGQPGHDGEPASPYADPNDPPRFLAAHMALIPRPVSTTDPGQRGKVLVWNFMRNNTGSGDTQHWAILDVTTNPPTFQNFDLAMPNGSGDLFCAGHAWTPRGELLVCGGDLLQPGGLPLANKLCYRFDPGGPVVGNGMWVQERDLHFARWYPTVTAMADGKLHVTGGFDASPPVNADRTYEVFDPSALPSAGSFDPNPNLPGTPPYFDGPAGILCTEEFGIYPRDIVLSSGKKFTAGMMSQSYRVLHQNVSLGNPPVWDLMPTFSGFGREYGSVVLFPNLGGSNGGYQDLVVRLGGTWTAMDPVNCTRPHSVVTNSVEVCQAGAPTASLAWAAHPSSMNFARTNQNAVLLPDGTVLVIGGKTDTADEFKTTNPVWATESFDGLTWTVLAPVSARRGYHSTALLLPDGRVLVGGGEQREWDYEIFRPPYLTSGLTRPVILNAPSTLEMGHGSTHGLEYAALPMGVYVAKVVLMAPGAITHHTDMHARYVELDIDSEVVPPDTGNPWRFFKAPQTAGHAPMGYYMLFYVTNQGVPSEATWVKLI